LGDFLLYAGERYRHPEEEYEKPFSDNDISTEEIDEVVVAVELPNESTVVV